MCVNMNLEICMFSEAPIGVHLYVHIWTHLYGRTYREDPLFVPGIFVKNPSLVKIETAPGT